MLLAVRLGGGSRKLLSHPVGHFSRHVFPVCAAKNNRQFDWIHLNFTLDGAAGRVTSAFSNSTQRPSSFSCCHRKSNIFLYSTCKFILSIILEAAYSLKDRAFVDNLGTILLYAVLVSKTINSSHRNFFVIEILSNCTCMPLNIPYSRNKTEIHFR